MELHAESAASTGEQVIGGVVRGLVELGDEVTFRGRHVGLTFAMTARVTGLDRPRWFRDSMVRGPFARFDHDHLFEPVSDEDTIMRDVFDFTSPLGPIGRLADRLVLERHLARFLAERAEVLRGVAESETWRRYVSA